MINKGGGGGDFKILWGGHSCYEGGHRAHGGIPPVIPPLGKTLLCVFSFFQYYHQRLISTTVVMAIQLI